MTKAEELADVLAERVVAHVEATGDEEAISTLSGAIGETSQTLQEAFVTSVRVRRAAIRADRLLAERIASHGEGV